MNLYDRYVMPLLIDCCCGMKEIQGQRAALVPRAKGRVLEIGIGTGHNLPFYDPTRLDSLQGLDPADQMSPTARKRALKAGLEVELITLSAEEIPAPDASYDTVVCTFTLCTIPDPLRALREMRRVLKPDGELLFCEHGRAPDVSVQRWQDRLTPWWKPIAGGCHLNRDVPEMLRDGGFVPTEIESSYLSGPKPMVWVTRGVAVAA
ncbi:class I SAM-dependent methyltransferase [Polycyclovorans algicola]|uniref:class I SAM-dependent methyltransferase n=1 Tax=Polycyclovorans algicola TaxID=616992 RepID=UPI0004A75066|nr:class I SAM-dependent methyltransferase [Polycyclovorans algicola]